MKYYPSLGQKDWHFQKSSEEKKAEFKSLCSLDWIRRLKAERAWLKDIKEVETGHKKIFFKKIFYSNEGIKGVGNQGRGKI